MDAEVQWEDITPEIAQQYLQLNIDNNRNPSNDRVDRLARDMERGDWIPTADPIKFNRDGRLIDGQHRLRAIMRSGITARVLVARNVHEDAVLVVDTGLTRTVAQTLKIGHSTVKNQSVVVAIAQLVNGWEQGVFRTTVSTFTARERMSTPEAIRYIEKHAEVLENAAVVATSLTSALPLTQSVIGAAYVILSRIDPDAAAEFFSAIRLGNSGRGEDDPIVTLVRRVYQDRLNSRRVSQALGLFLIFRTWNAWRSNERLAKLQVSSAANGYVTFPELK